MDLSSHDMDDILVWFCEFQISRRERELRISKEGWITGSLSTNISELQINIKFIIYYYIYKYTIFICLNNEFFL